MFIVDKNIWGASIIDSNGIISFWNKHYPWAFSRIISILSLRFLSHPQNESVLRYRWVIKIPFWWFWPRLLHRCVRTCRLVLRWQCRHRGWLHHFRRRLRIVFSFGRFIGSVGSRWLLRCGHQVPRWVCRVEILRNAGLISAGQSPDHRCWCSHCLRRLNLRWPACSSWYLLPSICTPFLLYYTIEVK